jgi:small subunit ribosomal protein S20
MKVYRERETLANSRSAKKRIRTNARKHLRNQMYRSRVKTMVKKAEQSIVSGTQDDEALRLAVKTLDKAAVKGIIHKNNAARRKSRLMKKFNAARQEATSAGT